MADGHTFATTNEVGARKAFEALNIAVYTASDEAPIRPSPTLEGLRDGLLTHLNPNGFPQAEISGYPSKIGEMFGLNGSMIFN